MYEADTSVAVVAAMYLTTRCPHICTEGIVHEKINV